ncbi:hypothetical protein SHINM1_018060 [Fluviibacter phosphoraccumulans]|nr:hypothetical protein SHINM1_018060 [Fluviibacter phosphoraccumulans]
MNISEYNSLPDASIFATTIVSDSSQNSVEYRLINSYRKIDAIAKTKIEIATADALIFKFL